VPVHPSFQRTDHRPWNLPKGAWRWRQSWLDLLFAHFPVPAAKLQALVPDGVEIQEFDGTSWVGLVPFRMEGVTPRHFPDLPGLSAFPELNLRLYVDVGGRPGVWFVSLDAANAVAVWAARRFFHLPYFHATMNVKRQGERIQYSCERTNSPVRFRGTYYPKSSESESKPGSIEHFLTERYCLYTRHANGALLRADVHHVPWPLQRAGADIEENVVAGPQGIELAGPPALLHFARRLDVVVWNVERVRP
jgi:uncharacterized protein YqjF (DUF2071 family)